MAGWSFGGTQFSSRNDFPAPGADQATWWQDWVWASVQNFVAQTKALQPNINVVSVQANNGAGDYQGIGTVTITLTTS